MKNLITHIKKYVTITDDEANKLTEIIEVKNLKRKAYLTRAGDICKYNYFVSQGCLRMYFIRENGTEQITQIAIENWWLADYMALLKQQETPFFIQAVEKSTILALDVNAAENLFKQIPQLERYYRIMFQFSYAASQFRIKYLYDYSREELYHHFATQFPEFVQRVPQYMLASYLGFTPEYLSEIRKKK
ncbi:MAG: cyclic nucleotide-binding protein [Pseudozobellia sp.]|nr:cyclic nucleotide-binding protein [Pseudozobellia sp.]MBG48866.1 cyclic nucleotide-binding protein [Pseudozobellia sp.]|tara:strand:+ start:711 stop:1277 length:567 start_codon:yes stop_codon:yes gene_type:complete